MQRNPAAGLLVHSERGTQYARAEDHALFRVWQKDDDNHAEAMTTKKNPARCELFTDRINPQISC